MRELPDDSLSALICDSLYNKSKLDIKWFLSFVNINKTNILVSPSQNDKIILMNAIYMYLNKLNMDNINIDDIMIRVSKVYNKSFIKYLPSNVNLIDSVASEELNFLSKDCVATIDKVRKDRSTKLPDEVYKLSLLQIFVCISVWLDIDKYLKYLYYLYR